MRRKVLGFFLLVPVQLISAVIAATAGLVVVGRHYMAEEPRETQILGMIDGKEVVFRPGLSLGAEDAPVGVVVFSDFECPYCGDFATGKFRSVADELVRSGQVRIGFRHFPLSNIHPAAFELAVLAECAARQGEFWSVHDALFRHPTQQDPKRRWRILDRTRFDQGKLRTCQEGEGGEAVQADIAEGRSLRINGTPTLLIGRQERGRLRVSRVIDGVPEPALFRAAIDTAANVSR